MYPFKHKDIWILGATWINRVGVVVVRNSYGEVRAYMRSIPEYGCYKFGENEELQDAIYIALHGSSISLKAAKELGVYWDETQV